MPSPATIQASSKKIKRVPLEYHLPERKYRPELHGIRGIAILGVVLFHLFGDGRVSGGIDVFLAISGFLFTGMLLREAAETGGAIRASAYLARLVRRLLPPAVLVISVTTVVGLLTLPSPNHSQLLREARASLLYFENFELVWSQLAYGAAGPSTSPLQHFWSLSVQGQFYVVWPVAVVLSVWFAKRIQVSAAQVMLGVALTVTIGSLAYATHLQEFDQQRAYLLTSTRFWELGFGAVLALLLTRIRIPARASTIMGWLGLSMILSTGFIFNGAELFPGLWALWPLVGFALILISAPSGTTNTRGWTAVRLLSTAPLLRVGDLAYSLFLWHWPVLIFYIEVRDYPEVGPRGALVVFVTSFGLAWLTHRFVEVPIMKDRSSSRWKTLSWGGGVLALTATTTSIVLMVTTVPLPEGYSLAGVDRDVYPGASSIQNPEVKVPDADIYPALSALSNDKPMYLGWGCMQEFSDSPETAEVLVCEDPKSPERPGATIMLAGGSHAGMWHHAFAMLAEKNNWELLIADKSGCRFGPADDPEGDACHAWQRNFMDVVEERQPDVVVTPGTVSHPAGTQEQIWPGAPERWDEVVDAGSEVLLMRGTARPEERAADCLSNGGTSMECGPDGNVINSSNPLEKLDLSEGIYSVDMLDYICPGRECPAVIGNIAVYRDASHLSNSYVESLAPYLDEKIKKEMPDLYARVN